MALDTNNFIFSYALKFLCVQNNSPNQKPVKVPEIVRIFFVLISSFACMLVLLSTFKFSHVFQAKDVPIIVPSWAATIILTCNGLESPLGQPFSLFFGTFFTSIIGIGLTKLWMLREGGEETLWVCGALATSISSVFMSYAKLIHPAAGSASLLAAISPAVRHMGWYYLVIQIVTGLLIICVSSVFANIYAQYPLFWFMPPNLAKLPSKAAQPVQMAEQKETEFNQQQLQAYTNSTTESEEISVDMAMPVPYTQSNASTLSLSRVPTAQDSIFSSRSQTHNHIASSISQTLSRAISHSRYQQPLDNISTDSDSDSLSVLISSTNFSIPRSVVFTQEDRGILISIQRKLANFASTSWSNTFRFIENYLELWIYEHSFLITCKKLDIREWI